jgi:hypothetical protein
MQTLQNPLSFRITFFSVCADGMLTSCEWATANVDVNKIMLPMWLTKKQTKYEQYKNLYYIIRYF